MAGEQTENEQTKSAVTATTTAPTPTIGMTKEARKDEKVREKYNETLAELKETKEFSASELAKMNEKVAALEASANQAVQRAIQAEIKAVAISEGLTDTDFIKLMDTSKVTINESGELEGAKEAVMAFKTAKPALFTAAKKTSSSTNADVGTSTAQKKESVFDWDKDKFKSSLASVPHSFS